MNVYGPGSRIMPMLSQLNVAPISLCSAYTAREPTRRVSSKKPGAPQSTGVFRIAALLRQVDRIDPSYKTLPQFVHEELHRFECERIALNLQMSVVHSLYRQASTCAIKMASADRLLRQFTPAVELSQ